MKRLLLCLFLLPTFAAAADIDDAVRNVAESKMSMMTTIYEKNVEVVYVGTDNLCEAVSIMWTHQRIENFRVCNGEVQHRNTVSPAWDETDGRLVLTSVINNAIRYGHAKQKDNNGYLVSAMALGAVSHDCKNIEVIVSYDGDLVDRGVHEVCGK
jgi:hypothetical protein